MRGSSTAVRRGAERRSSAAPGDVFDAGYHVVDVCLIASLRRVAEVMNALVDPAAREEAPPIAPFHR